MAPKSDFEQTDPKRKPNRFEEKFGEFISIARESEESRVKEMRALREEFEFLSATAQDIIKASGGERGLFTLERDNPELFNELNLIRNRMAAVTKNMRKTSMSREEIPIPKSSGTVTIGQGQNKIEFTDRDIERLLEDPDFAVEQFNILREQGTPGQIEAFTDFVGDQFVNDLVEQSNLLQRGPAITPPTPAQPANQNEVQRALGTIRSFFEPRRPPGLQAEPLQESGQDALRRVENTRRELLRERNR